MPCAEVPAAAPPGSCEPALRRALADAAPACRSKGDPRDGQRAPREGPRRRPAGARAPARLHPGAKHGRRPRAHEVRQAFLPPPRDRPRVQPLRPTRNLVVMRAVSLRSSPALCARPQRTLLGFPDCTARRCGTPATAAAGALGPGHLELTISTPAFAAPTRAVRCLLAGYSASSLPVARRLYYLHGADGDEARFAAWYGKLIGGLHADRGRPRGRSAPGSTATGTTAAPAARRPTRPTTSTS